jgi:hypothetical protein
LLIVSPPAPSKPVAISEDTQSALSELRQELELHCCEVVLKKKNAQLLLEIIEAAGTAALLFDGDITGSFDEQMHQLKFLLGKAVGL